MNKLFLGLFIFLGLITFGATKADAATFLLAQGSDGRSLYATVNASKYDHTPGEEVQATICVDNQSAKINLGNTMGGTNGTWKTFLSGAPCRTAAAGYAPSSAGIYAANFETNFTRANPACSDGVDNDGDGHTDYPNDPGCWGVEDDDEYNAPATVPNRVAFRLSTTLGGPGQGPESYCLANIEASPSADFPAGYLNQPIAAYFNVQARTSSSGGDEGFGVHQWNVSVTLPAGSSYASNPFNCSALIGAHVVSFGILENTPYTNPNTYQGKPVELEYDRVVPYTPPSGGEDQEDNNG